MPTRNVSLTEELDLAVTQRVRSGMYENASEVIRAALRALLEHERVQAARLAAVRSALDHGERSGLVEDDAFERVRTKLGLLLESQ